MKVRELLKDLGITEERIQSITGNLDASIDEGYEIERKTFSDKECIVIYPYIKWTDGSVKPAYCSNSISIFYK